MLNASQYINAGATTAIINAFSSGGVVTSSGQAIAATALVGSREVLSGALTAATLAALLTVDGPGRVPLLSVYAKDSTSRTMRLVVEVDGVTVFDATSAATAAVSTGMIATGFISQSSPSLFVPGESIVFSSSLVVRVASSLTETDKLAIAYILHRS